MIVPSPSTHWTHREETPTPLVVETVHNPQPPYTFETRLDPRYQIYQTGRPHTADLNVPRRPVPPPLDHGEDIFDPAVYRTLGDGGPPTKSELSEIERIREGRCWTGGRYCTNYWILKEYPNSEHKDSNGTLLLRGGGPHRTRFRRSEHLSLLAPRIGLITSPWTE